MGSSTVHDDGTGVEKSFPLDKVNIIRLLPKLGSPIQRLQFVLDALLWPLKLAKQNYQTKWKLLLLKATLPWLKSWSTCHLKKCARQSDMTKRAVCFSKHFICLQGQDPITGWFADRNWIAANNWLARICASACQICSVQFKPRHWAQGMAKEL